jgi:hypothetical protein
MRKSAWAAGRVEESGVEGARVDPDQIQIRTSDSARTLNPSTLSGLWTLTWILGCL